MAAALRIPLTELAGLPAAHAEGPGRILPRVRHEIEFTQRDDSNGELRITGGDDAALLLWGAAWLDEHHEWIIEAMSVRPGDYRLTATVVIELASLACSRPVTRTRSRGWGRRPRSSPMPV